MMSYTDDKQLEGDVVLETELKVEAKERHALRKEYLPEYKKAAEADEWEKTGESVSFEPAMEKIKWIPQ